MRASILVLLMTTIGHGAIYPAYIPNVLDTLPQGVPIRNTASVSELSIYGTPDSVIAVSGDGFTEALRADVAEAGAQPWSIGLRIAVDTAVAQGDVCLMVFWARAIEAVDETSEGWVEALFERSSDPWTKSLNVACAPNGQWQWFAFAFESAESYAAGECHFGMNFGGRVQRVDIAGIDIIHFGNALNLERLQSIATKPTYPGRDADAAWRVPAQERIERIRKGDLRLTIVRGGTPVSGATVRFRMTRHAFGFGTAVAVYRIHNREQAYIDTLSTLFNKSVTENKLKWRQWTQSGVAAASDAIDWMRGQGMDVRGHVLVWPSWRYMPPWVSQDNATLLNQQITGHIDTAVSMFAGRLVEWDVINEPYANHDAMDLIGQQAMVEWFQRARAQDPDVALYINDYGILAGENAGHREAYYQTIQYLLDNGAPLDGIGLQSHFGQTPTGLDKVIGRLDQFAAFGKDLQITEFDVNTTDEQLQADYTRDFLTAVFSHPAVTGFMMWGFWANAHWKPEAAMYRADWTPKPNAHAYRALVFDRWWTDETLTSGADGSVAIRGFKGSYEVAVTTGDETRSFVLGLGDTTIATLDLESGDVLQTSAAIAAPNSAEPRLVVRCEPGRVALTLARAAPGSWSLALYDTAGRRVANRESIEVDRAEFDSGTVAPGSYLVSVRIGPKRLTARLVVP
ncbi:MAG: energy transducer TonB [Chitinivibrionales bacterium]|nr:energy transducer TonB [Chitinivibrionales bacterium]